MLSLITTFIYFAALAYLVNVLLFQKRQADTKVLGFIALALGFHALSVYDSVITPEGARLGFFKIASLFFFVINTLVLISSFKKPLHNIYLFLLPLTIIALAVNQSFDSEVTHITKGLLGHILLSILAYSLLTIASFQALLLAYQNNKLKNKQLHGGLVSLMPPLQTMETLLFELIWAGFGFLTLAIITGAIFIDDIFAQQLTHKTAFSLLSWLIYAVLLSGRHSLGWRGSAAIRWTLGGFAALMLAYFGSKLAIEIILGNG